MSRGRDQLPGGLTAEDMPGEVAALWCIRLSEGDMEAAEWEEFDAWLAQPGNADLLQKAASIWEATGEVGNWPNMLAMRAQALEDVARATRQRWWRMVAPRWIGQIPARAAWAMAASVLLVVTLGLTLLAIQPRTYATQVGERQLAVLEDSSRVSLDAATKVQARMKETGRQIELLEGRAKFDVAKDSLRPFTVAVGDKLVVAVGTSFSVELIDGQVRVILYEGQVEVRDRSDTVSAGQATSRRYLLSAGSELIDTVGTAAPAKISQPDLTQTLIWEQGLLSFDREPLASAVERMNRYSPRPIRVVDPKLGSITIDGIYKAGDVGAFVEGVTALYPVRRKEGAGGAVLLEAK